MSATILILFRETFTAELTLLASSIVVTALVYRFLKPVDERFSIVAASAGSLASAVQAFACAVYVARLVIQRAAHALSIDGLQEVRSLDLAVSDMHIRAYTTGLAMFGLYCLLVGGIIFRSSARGSSQSRTTKGNPTLMRRIAMTLALIFALDARAAADSDTLAAGRAALRRSDIDQAISQLEKAVSLNANNAEAHYFLGTAYARKGERAGMLNAMSWGKKANAEWARAVELNPNYNEARMSLIDFYVMAPGMMGGDKNEALKQAAEIKKRDALEGHRAYARIHTLGKELDLAVKEMVEAVREQPKSAKAHYYLGNALLNYKDWKGSLHEYEMSVSLDPSYMPAYFRIGQHAVQSESNYARGEQAIRKYLGYEPADNEPRLGTAWYWLGMIQEKQGKKAEARQSYLNAQKLAPDLKELPDALKRVS